jgi:hypothetical protein
MEVSQLHLIAKRGRRALPFATPVRCTSMCHAIRVRKMIPATRLFTEARVLQRVTSCENVHRTVWRVAMLATPFLLLNMCCPGSSWPAMSTVKGVNIAMNLVDLECETRMSLLARRPPSNRHLLHPLLARLVPLSSGARFKCTRPLLRDIATCLASLLRAP